MKTVIIESLNHFIRQFDTYIDESIEYNKPSEYRNRLDKIYGELIDKGKVTFTSSRTGEEVTFITGEKK